MKPTFKKIIIVGATLVTGTFAAPIVPAEMQLMYSYKDNCQYEWSTKATTTREDPRTYKPDCTEGEYAASVFSDRKGNAVYKEIPLTQYHDMGIYDGIKNNPKDTELITIFESLTPKAEAAIAYDLYTDGAGGGAVSSLTFAHTVTGTDPLITVGASCNDLSDTISGVTYNSVSLTQNPTGSPQSSSGGGSRTERIYGFYLANPATGSHNVVITATGQCSNGLSGYSISYTGVDQTTPVNVSSGNAATSVTTLSVTPVTSVADTWAVTFARDDAGSITDGTNYVGRGADSSFEMGDSNASTGAAGSKTVTIGGASGTLKMVTAMIAPAASAGGTIVPLQNYILFE